MSLHSSTRWAAPVALGNPVERTRLLHLLPRSDRIAFLQELGKCGSSRLRNLILKLLRQVGECHVRMNRLDVTKKLVGQPTRTALQRRDALEHGAEDDRLHDVTRRSRH